MMRSNRQSSFAAIHAAQRYRRNAAVLVGNARHLHVLDEAAKLPSLLMQAVVIPAGQTAHGILIDAAALPWFEIVRLIDKRPELVYEIDWRTWEEIVAGAYAQQGFDVTLTPRSNDGGRDVIAEKRGFGSICFFEQVKAYAPGHLVTAEEVRAMLGVLDVYQNVSKGIVTTTSEFAPGIERDQRLAALMPYRIELKSGRDLVEWLRGIAKEPRSDTEG